MGLDRDTLEQLRHLLRPLSNRIANTVARAVVTLVDASTKLQGMQVHVPETRADAEHFQPYGFHSVPLPGAEGLALFPNGDRAHPLVFAVADRRYAPTGGDAGDVVMHHFTGAQIKITKDGDMVATPAPGRTMQVHDGAGAAGLPTMADFAGIITILSTCGAGPATAVPATLSSYQAAHPTWPDGTKVLRGK